MCNIVCMYSCVTRMLLVWSLDSYAFVCMKQRSSSGPTEKGYEVDELNSYLDINQKPTRSK